MSYVFPSDQDRADDDQLNEACERIEELMDQLASREALEGEAIGEVGYMFQPNWDDPSKTKRVALVDKSLAPGTKLYTHPASRQAVSVPEWQLEARRAFWAGIEIAECFNVVAIAPRWDEYIAKRKEDLSQYVTRAGDGDGSTPTKADEWIKCSERLPSEADHYLVALSDPEDVGWVTDKAWTAFYNKGGEWDCCEAVEDGQPVTHWMPLPCPPKQEKGND